MHPISCARSSLSDAASPRRVASALSRKASCQGYSAGIAAGATITEETVGEIFTHEKGIFKGTPEHALRIAFFNQADLPGARESGKTIAGWLGDRETTGLKRIVIGQTKLEPPVLEYLDLN